jgi:hypothetical protein
MERQGCGLGCIVASLGLVLSCCLIPHLLSSIYSIVAALLQVPAAPNWLWGDWISTWPLVRESEALYMTLAEGPLCCAGTLALLFIVLGVVSMIAGLGRGQDLVEDEYEYFEES